MPMPRLLAIVTAMMLTGSPGWGQQAFTIEDLRKIESLILAKNCGALRAHLRANPRFTIGNDPLASELRGFAADVDRGRIDCATETRVAAARRTGLPARSPQASRSRSSANIPPSVY